MSKRVSKKESNLVASSLPFQTKIIFFLLAIAQGVCPLLFFTNLTRNPYYTQIVLLNFCIIAVLFVWALTQLTRQNVSLPRLPIQLPLFCFLLVALMSTVWSWINHPSVRPGIVFEGSRIWAFTTANAVMALYLPFLFVVPLDTKKKELSIWTDVILALTWAGLWLCFHTFRDSDPLLLVWDTYGALLWGLALIYLWARTRQGTAESFVHVIFAVSVVASLYALSQYGGRDVIWSGTLTPYGGRPVSTFGNPNFLSSYVMMVSPLALAFMLNAEKKSEARGYAVVAGFCILATLSTLTRSSYVGLLAALACFGFLLRSFSWLLVRKVGLTLAIILGIFFIFPKTPVTGTQSPIARFTEVFDAAKTGETYGPWHQRILIWSSAMDMVLERPVLGKGWGCFELFYPFYQGKHLFNEKLSSLRTHANNAHNVLLELLAQVGLLGTGMALWLMTSLGLLGARKVKLETDPARKIWMAGLLSAVMGMLADNFFGNVSVFFAMPAFLFWWIAGSLLKEVSPVASPEQPQSVKSRFVFLGIIVLCVLTGVYFSRRWMQEYFYFEGFKHSRTNHVNEAVRSLEKAYRWFPGEVNGNYELGNAYARQAAQYSKENSADLMHETVEKSLGAYNAALRANPGYDEIYFNLGVTQLQTGHEEDGVKNLETALLINPLLPSVYNALGNHYIKNKKFDDAKRVFEQAVLLMPREKDYWNNLGYTYGQMELHEKAFDAFRRAFQLDPGFTSAAQNLATTATKLKKFDPILAVPGLISGMQSDLSKQDYKAAQLKAQKLVELLPDNADAALSKANIEFYLHNISASIQEYQRALNLRPDFAIAYMNLGLLYKNQNQLTEARAAFQRVLQIKPDDADAKRELASLPPTRP